MQQHRAGPTRDTDMSQPALHQRETHSLDDDPESGFAASPPLARQPSRELLRAWLLLLLQRRSAHGYELHRQLKSNGVLTEPGSLYRTLRRLESEGCTASCWEESVAGPRRRQYELTSKGERELGDLVRSITDTRDVHAAFLRAHDGTFA